LVLIWRLAIRTLLNPLTPQTFSPTAIESWIDASSLAALVWWISLETIAEKNPGPTAPILLLILCIGSAILLVSWHIAGSAMAAAGIGVICGAALVLSIWSKRISFSRGAVVAVALPLQALVIHGFFYTGDTLTNVQLICAAIFMACPLLAFLGDLPRIPRGWRLTVRILALLAAIAAVGGLSLREAARVEQNQQMEESL
jgi:hypothetical protein